MFVEVKFGNEIGKQYYLEWSMSAKILHEMSCI
jgi:hypothetical protein